MAREGRPLKFTTVEDLEVKITAYFDSCFEEKWFDEDARDENGNIICEDTGPRAGLPIKKHTKKKNQLEPLTITGLAYALDTSRQTLINYQEKTEFFDTIKKAKDFIEYHTEKGLVRGDIPTSAGQFVLKNNYDWKDKTELEHSGEINNPYANYTDEQLRQKSGRGDNPPQGKSGTDLPDGTDIALSKDRPDTQEGRGVSENSQGNLQEGNPVITEKPLENNGDNNIVDNPAVN